MDSQSKMYSFNLLNDDKNKIELIYDEYGKIDIGALIPEYKYLMDAMKSGISWYDIIYPYGEKTNKINGTDLKAHQEPDWKMVDKKRKRTNCSPVNYSSNKKKKM
jgi:hypothetical protein